MVFSLLPNAAGTWPAKPIGMVLIVFSERLQVSLLI